MKVNVPSSDPPTWEKLVRLVQEENIAEIQSLLARFPKLLDIESTRWSGDTLLHEAVNCNRIRMVEWLLNTKLGLVDEVNFAGSTPLSKAALGGCIEIVKFILELRPDLIWALGKYGQTVLSSASMGYNSEEVVKFLLEFEPKLINVVDNEGHTALYCAYLLERKNLITIFQNKLDIDLVLKEAAAEEFKDKPYKYKPYLAEFQQLVIGHCTPLLAYFDINIAKEICQYIIGEDKNAKIIFDPKLQSLVLLTAPKGLPAILKHDDAPADNIAELTATVAGANDDQTISPPVTVHILGGSDDMTDGNINPNEGT